MGNEHPKSEKDKSAGVPKPGRARPDESENYRATDTTGAGDPMAPGQGHPATPRPADEGG